MPNYGSPAAAYKPEHGGRDTQVSILPKCDIFGCGQHARYDAKTVFGPWAYLCETHFESQGVGLGTGQGQYLYTADEKENS